MSFGVRLSFASGFVLDAMPGWEEAMLMPLEQKRHLLADPNERRRLAECASSPDNPMRNLARWDQHIVFDVKSEANARFRGRTVGDIATELGKEPFDALLDLALDDDLFTSFGTRDPEQSRADWEARVGVWRDGRAVIGASDAGAHLDLLASFNYTTILLASAVREHQLLPLEEAVQLLTDVPARLYGLRERGRLAEGWHADVVVLDEDTVASDEIGMRFDLPGGSPRLYAEAQGIDHVLVGGTPVVTDGALTEARPGRVIRSGRDTANPSLD
jgi:N-acyl-D-aspartate/D-glutamate deacylase